MALVRRVQEPAPELHLPEPFDLVRGAEAEDLERAHKRAGLELSRSRVARELEGARTPAHRAALENALRYLDDELAKT